MFFILLLSTKLSKFLFRNKYYFYFFKKGEQPCVVASLSAFFIYKQISKTLNIISHSD